MSDIQEPMRTNWLSDDTGRTDNELANRFINANEHKLRYVMEWGKWLIWDGKRWQVDPNETMLLRLARRFAYDLWDDFTAIARFGLEPKEMAKIITFCKSANKDNGMRAFLNLARADERIAVQLADLNSHTHLLNLRNGTFNLDSGELQPHSQDDLLTQLAEVEHDEPADCPRWKETLSMIFDGDPELIRYVQQLLGYSLTGDTGEHILPIAYGSGCNGKSTIWNAVLSLLGDYGGLANDSLLMGVKDTHPTEKAFLYQKRFVPISEPEQSARLRESRVKELTGDGTITARRMHEDFWSFTRTHTFWLSTNHLPRITGNDDGIWRRVKLIPFTVDLRKVTTPIPDLDKQLVTEEGPGILNWLIAGYLDYRRNGFIEPEVIKVATNGYRDQEDEIAMFIADRCVTGNQFVVPASALFDAYFKWGGKENRTMFGKAIGERFAKQIRSSGVYRKQTVYEGVGLSSESDDF